MGEGIKKYSMAELVIEIQRREKAREWRIESYAAEGAPFCDEEGAAVVLVVYDLLGVHDLIGEETEE